jgi:hypothetical protein
MERDKLLRIIQKDLHELNEITDELTGKQQISMQEIEFALGKSRIICQEFYYLKELTLQSLLPGMEAPRETPSFSKELSKDQAVMEQKYEEDDKGTIDHQLSGSPLTMLKVAIGLNDRFQFIRELFNNDTSLFDHTVEQIDQMGNISEAVTFLNSNFKWKRNETSLKFAQLVKRRFSD